MSVVILYGTETGNGELVADAIADVLAAEHDPSIYDMSEFAVEDLDPDDFLVVVCSTYGEGELPTGAEPFAEEITEPPQISPACDSAYSDSATPSTARPSTAAASSWPNS